MYGKEGKRQNILSIKTSKSTHFLYNSPHVLPLNSFPLTPTVFLSYIHALRCSDRRWGIVRATEDVPIFLPRMYRARRDDTHEV